MTVDALIGELGRIKNRFAEVKIRTTAGIFKIDRMVDQTTHGQRTKSDGVGECLLISTDMDKELEP
jgi:hypothetical protein